MGDENELGAFLRARREATKPADVGLPDTGRRRTPGLRREELATLAGVSVDYLVRLEQGRDRNPSASVVLALADALRLDNKDRVQLKILSQCESASQLCPFEDSPFAAEVPATMREVLARLDPTPAVVLGPWYDVLAANPAWECVMRPSGVLDGEGPNLARFTFLDPRSRQLDPDWASTADEQVAVIRQARLRWRDHERLRLLLAELEAVPEFARRWKAHTAPRGHAGPRVLRHPDAGELRVSTEVLRVDSDNDQRLVVWLPADDATDAALRRLTGGLEPVSPARLRVVGD